MRMRTNAIAWNPMEAFNFVAANEVRLMRMATRAAYSSFSVSVSVSASAYLCLRRTRTNCVLSAHTCLHCWRDRAPLYVCLLSFLTTPVALAPQDHNLYTFDMRRLDKARKVHKDHVSAVLDIDFSPTGQEFVTGAYDKSLRIFSSDDGHSRLLWTPCSILPTCLTAC